MSSQLFFIGLLLLLSILSTSCGRTDTLSEGDTIEARISPNGKLNAFVWKAKLSGGLGATVSQPYQVWIEFRDDRIKKLVLEGDKTAPFKILWINSEQLQICYSNAQIYKFRNKYALASEDSDEIREFEVILQKVNDIKECTQ